MRKQIRRLGFCLTLAAIFWCGGLIAHRQQLRNELIRLHVVANSDSEEDQNIKLRVRDAVLESLRSDLEKVQDMEQAKQYIQEKLPQIEHLANEALRSAGCSDEAVVSLCTQAFDTRHYDTFSLPAGIYESLRITIGAGEGKNWWCVVYPAFCIPAASEEVADVAAGAGFSDALTDTLTRQEGVQIRFALLDALGKLENILFAG